MQYKSCQEAYEGAVNDEVVQSLGRIWLDYARYFEERNKYVSAQKVYLRALTGGNNHRGAVSDETNREILWQEFLRMMQERKDDHSLTLEQLKAAVAREEEEADAVMGVPQGEQFDSVSGAIDTAASVPDSELNDWPVKRTKFDSASAAASEDDQRAAANRIDKEWSALAQSLQSMPPDVQVVWMASDGDASPLRPEPLFAPSPPKLSDASGKDILGVDLALQLVQLMLNTSTPGRDLDGTVLLQICKACWAMTALKEKEAAKALSDLDRKMVSVETVACGDQSSRRVLVWCNYLSADGYCSFFSFAISERGSGRTRSKIGRPRVGLRRSVRSSQTSERK